MIEAAAAADAAVEAKDVLKERGLVTCAVRHHYSVLVHLVCWM